MECCHCFSDFVFLLNGKFKCFVVVVLPLKVVRLLVDGFLGHFAFIFFRLDFAVFLHRLLKFVAALVSTGGRAMTRPVPHAQPAEFVATATTGCRASHVVTPLVFLDGLFALRAGLGVGYDPLDIFALGSVLFFPFGDQLAVNRTVPLFLASEAPRVAALTVDEDILTAVHFCDEITVGEGAKFDVQLSFDL